MNVLDIYDAEEEDLEEVAVLFDRYRMFYGQDPDPDRAEAYLRERFEAGESLICVARVDGAAVGFTQVYPHLSSLSLGRVHVLNDIYVEEGHRGEGIGVGLLEAVRERAIESGAIRIELETGEFNKRAQAVYEAFGFVQQSGMLHYVLPLNP